MVTGRERESEGEKEREKEGERQREEQIERKKERWRRSTWLRVAAGDGYR